MNTLLRQTALRLARPIHVLLRTRKVGLLCKLASSQSPQTLLDVGGGVGIAGEFAALYGRFSRVVVLNLKPPSQEQSLCSHIMGIAGDGCNLPFKDRSFDWVFSNAVIEHVGDYPHQQKFANEIRRVSTKGYFVTTPNKYFPIEPHALLPFYQFLSTDWQRRLVRFSPGYLQEYEEINLLSAKQLSALFPEARITATGFPILGNSLIAHYQAIPA